jgi:hypothetical protein
MGFLVPISKANRAELVATLRHSKNPEVQRRLLSHDTAASRRFNANARQDFANHSSRKSINFVNRFGFDEADGSNRLARHGLKTSLPRRRSLTPADQTYLGLPGNAGVGTRQGLGAFRGGEPVDYQLPGNRRVRKSSPFRTRGSDGKFASNKPGFKAVSVELRGGGNGVAGDPKERSKSIGRRLR